MAESPQSTSENPQDEKLGLGLLITDTAPSDPVAVTSQFVEIQHSEASHNAPDGKSDALPEAAVEVVEKSATGDEESVLLNAIEKDLFNLIIEQAEIEPARDKLEAVDDEEEEGKGVGTVKEDNIDEVMDEQDADSVEDGDENDGGDEENVEYVREQSEDALRKSGNYNQIVNRRRNNYPMRPDAEDCAFYMKFGSCKFGMNCKFNHPPRRKSQGVKEKANNGEESSERAGQTECKYYLTSGGCKYGKDCKYFHGSDKSSTSQALELNFLGLPIRPGEKECPYYMRTGSCKYGSNCRFHHPDPEPTAVVGGDSPLGYGNGASLPSQLVSASSMSSWSPPRAFNETSSFVPVMFPPTQVASTSNPEWNGYQAAIYPTSENSLPTPPAFAIANLTAEINLPLQQHDMLDEEYPERPGEPECSFFLKTGDCKFKSNCKFHHPKNRISKAKANSSALNDKGLPLRPDQPICTHYYRYGICKYGPACRYDHPSKFAISRPTFDQPPFGNSNFVGATELRKGSES